MLKSPWDHKPRLAEQPPLQARTPEMRKAPTRNTKRYHIIRSWADHPSSPHPNLLICEMRDSVTLPGHPQTVVVGRNEKELVSVIYCCVTNSPKLTGPKQQMFSLVVSGSQGSRRGSAEWFKLTGMMLAGFTSWLTAETSVPCHVGPSMGLPDCPQDTAADFPPQKML